MWQIEQDSFSIGRSFKYRAQKMTAPAGDISNHFEARKIAGCDDGGDLPLRFCLHRRVKDPICFRVLREVTPEPARESSLHRRTAASYGIFQLAIRFPVDRQS